MIGYTERATRCSGSRSRIECSSTPAPSSGYMFWIAPIQTPIIPVRRSPKYFQVSDSGPSGWAVADLRLAAATGRGSADGINVGVIMASGVLVNSTIRLTTYVVYDFGVGRAVVLPGVGPLDACA